MIGLFFRRLRHAIRPVFFRWAGLKLRSRIWLAFFSVPCTVASLVFKKWLLPTVVVGLFVLNLLNLLNEWARRRQTERTTAATLQRYGESLTGHHKFGKYLVVYRIDWRRSGYGDMWFRTFDITPTTDSPVALVHLMYVGALSAETPWRFKDLAVQAKSDGGRVLVFGEQEMSSRGRWRIQLLFDPVIEPEVTRHVNVSGLHPGVWDPIREDGVDQGRFHLDEDAKELEICVIFPRAWRRRRLQLVPNGHPEGATFKLPLVEDNATGEPQVRWTIAPAPAGNYKYTVIAQRADVEQELESPEDHLES